MFHVTGPSEVLAIYHTKLISWPVYCPQQWEGEIWNFRISRSNLIRLLHANCNSAPYSEWQFTRYRWHFLLPIYFFFLFCLQKVQCSIWVVISRAILLCSLILFLLFELFPPLGSWRENLLLKVFPQWRLHMSCFKPSWLLTGTLLCSLLLMRVTWAGPVGDFPIRWQHGRSIFWS